MQLLFEKGFFFAGLERSMTPQGHDKTRYSSPAQIKTHFM
jgi:hypothetical protein